MQTEPEIEQSNYGYIRHNTEEVLDDYDNYNYGQNLFMISQAPLSRHHKGTSKRNLTNDLTFDNKKNTSPQLADKPLLPRYTLKSSPNKDSFVKKLPFKNTKYTSLQPKALIKVPVLHNIQDKIT